MMIIRLQSGRNGTQIIIPVIHNAVDIGELADLCTQILDPLAVVTLLNQNLLAFFGLLNIHNGMGNHGVEVGAVGGNSGNADDIAVLVGDIVLVTAAGLGLGTGHIHILVRLGSILGAVDICQILGVEFQSHQLTLGIGDFCFQSFTANKFVVKLCHPGPVTFHNTAASGPRKVSSGPDRPAWI